ncbi:MAG TPA: LIM domain-containing protein [Clostridiales bacterium]|jgi:hypothetical protein|nr:LIM domain-containing protein [Clostridiales bacterium]HQP69250.1 LIM domain-containing protein [Clostridiales bacterium]
MNRIIICALVPFLLSVFPLVFPADKIFCDQCGNEIKAGSSYLIAGDKKYCDEECFEKSLPVCCVCGKHIKQGFVQDGKNYCSNECLQTTWHSCYLCGKKVSGGVEIGGSERRFFCQDCSALPVCFACGYPGNCNILPDGRNICSECEKSAVSDYNEALKIFKEVREVMRNKLKLSTKSVINFRLVNKTELEKRSEKPGEELGLFIHEKFTETETTTKTLYGFEIGKDVKTSRTDSIFICVLDHLPKVKFIEVAAHELAHDWMDKHYPGIKDLKINEGWAEYTASRINILYGNEKLNNRMRENPDPHYGEGYRYIADYVKNKGMKRLFSKFKSLSKSKI